MDACPISAFNTGMARCYQCYSVLAVKDSECYVCGSPVPGAKKKKAPPSGKAPKEAAPLTPISNILFIASLVFTVISFVLGEKMSLTVSATLSVTLFLARIFNDRVAAKRELALRPVTVPRLDR
jgi:hypothetical protein